MAGPLFSATLGYPSATVNAYETDDELRRRLNYVAGDTQAALQRIRMAVGVALETIASLRRRQGPVPW